MKVKHITAASGKTCTDCGSPLDHWKNKTNEKSASCSKKGCDAKATLGAHVTKMDSTDHAHYIVPLCDECSKDSGEFELNKNVKLVAAEACCQSDPKKK